jgi:PST family polysaccharide transporter
MRASSSRRKVSSATGGRPSGLGPLARSASWLAVGQISAQGYLSLLTLLAASVLSPEEFGAVAVQTVVISALLLLSDGGYAAAIIREPAGDRRDMVRRAFMWGACVATVGSVAAIALGGSAPLIALAFSAPTAGLCVTLQSAYTADHRFRRAATAQASGAAVGLAIGVAVLATGAASTALAVSFFGYLLVMLVMLSTGMGGGRSQRQSSTAGRFAVGAWGANLLNFAGSNIDYIVVGAILGPGPLGVYAFGYVVSTSIQTRVMSLANRAAFPLMVPLSAKARVAWYGDMLWVTVLVAAPAFSVLYIATPAAVSAALGPEWSSAIPVTRMLLGAGFAFTVGTSVGPLLLANGRSDVLFGFGLMRVVGMAGALIATARYGLLPAALSVVTYAWVAVPVTIGVALRTSGVSMAELVSGARAGTWLLIPLSLSMIAVLFADSLAGLSASAAAAATAGTILWQRQGVARGASPT